MGGSARTLIATAVLALGLAPSAHGAETLYILTGNMLSVAAADTVGTPYSFATPITGLDAAEDGGVGLDVNPVDGKLYLLMIDFTPSPDKVHLYVLNPATAVATPVGAAVDAPSGSEATFSYTIDVQPAVNRIRVIRSLDGKHFRLNPLDGSIAGIDTPMTFAPGDTGTGTPALRGAAYDSNFAGTASTTLWGLNVPSVPGQFSLVRVGSPGGTPVSPNTGLVTTIGQTGIATASTSVNGMEISGVSGLAYGAVSRFMAFDTTSTIYRVDLATAKSTPVSGSYPAFISDIALAPTAKLDLADATASAAENSGGVTLTVNRTASTTGTATVDYALNDGTATGGSDYTAATGTLTFADGETSKTISVPIADDVADEGRESFTVELSNATGNAQAGAVIGRRLETVAIEDNDAPPPVTPPTPDTTKPVVTLAGVPTSRTRARFLKGFTITLTPNEAAALVVTLESKTNKATLAKLKVTLFSKSLAQASGTQQLLVKPKRKGVGKVRKTRKVTLRVVATDAAKNRSTITRTIRVKRDRKA